MIARVFGTWLAPIVFGALAVGGVAWAQEYPTRPVTIVVPAAAGSPTDPLARMIAKVLEARLKQPFVVVNRVGAGGFIGADQVARSAPDGYTLLVTTDTALSSHLFSKQQRDLMQELTLIRIVSMQPLALLVSSSMQVGTVKDFVQAVKANPGKFNYGYVVNTTVQLETERLLRSAGLSMHGVSYSSTAPAVQALMAGDVHFVLSSLPTMKPVIDAGKGVALAVTSQQRFSQLPSLPTGKEAGLDSDFSNRQVLLGPAKMPQAIVDLLQREMAVAMDSPEIKSVLQGLILDPMPGTPADHRRQLAADAKVFEDMAKSMGFPRDQ